MTIAPVHLFGFLLGTSVRGPKAVISALGTVFSGILLGLPWSAVASVGRKASHQHFDPLVSCTTCSSGRSIQRVDPLYCSIATALQAPPGQVSLPTTGFMRTLYYCCYSTTGITLTKIFRFRFRTDEASRVANARRFDNDIGVMFSQPKALAPLFCLAALSLACDGRWLLNFDVRSFIRSGLLRTHQVYCYMTSGRFTLHVLSIRFYHDNTSSMTDLDTGSFIVSDAHCVSGRPSYDYPSSLQQDHKHLVTKHHVRVLSLIGLVAAVLLLCCCCLLLCCDAHYFYCWCCCLLHHRRNCSCCYCCLSSTTSMPFATAVVVAFCKLPSLLARYIAMLLPPLLRAVVP